MTDVGKSLGDLSQRLSQIPEATLVELVWSLEGKRAGNHTDSTAVTLLGQFRPRLQLVRPVRRMTAKRLFALPFEDMLTNTPPNKPKIIGKISRHVINPAWDLIVDKIGRTEVEQIEEEIRKVGRAHTSWLALGERLWPQCATALREIVTRGEKNVSYRAEVVPKLGGPEMWLDLQDVCDVLEIGLEIQQMRDNLPPKPIVALTDEDIGVIGQTVMAVDERMKVRAPVVVYALVARLDQPTEILSIFVRVAEKGMAGSTGELASITTEVMVTDMEQRFEEVRRQIASGANDGKITVREDLAKEVGHHLEGINKGKEQLKGTSGAAAARRLDRVRMKLKEMVSANVIENAGKEIATVLADLKRLAPMATGEGDITEMQQVEDRLLAMQLAAKYAGELGISQELKDELKRVEGHIDGHTGKLFFDLRSKGLKAENREAAEADLYSSVRMLELVSGAERAEKTLVEGLSLIDEKLAENKG
ncbi:MAG: hypothetical protein GC202_08910 [Alphaproteobacteria bacterium]|nr:hypothetical protein [Alphaproteobacteria bacterium]